MEGNTEAFYLKRCLEKVELQLKRGPAGKWTGYDFEQLSHEIMESTGILLSVTTLKRIWGKLKYTSLPAITTLNALAKYTGSSDWNAFKQEMAGHVAEEELPSEREGIQKASKYVFWLIGGSLLLILIALFAFFYPAPRESTDRASYSFSSNKILSAGLPNSVIFNYKVPESGKTSVFITQSWDESRKVEVSRKNHVFSSIYYEPGHYKAKLMVGDMVMKQHELLIRSTGWMGMTNNESGTPIYFRPEEILKDNKVVVDDKLLTKYNLAKPHSAPLIRFFNVQDIKGIASDNFTFETSIKGSAGNYGIPCQKMEVSLMGKGDIMSIPLCSKGCVGDLSLYAWGQVTDSKTADLSGFGCDLNDWVKVRLESKNGITNIFVNGRLAHAVKHSGPPVSIIGLRYSFNGAGSVQDTRLTNGNNVINF